MISQLYIIFFFFPFREKKREKERNVGHDIKLGLNLCLGLDRFVLELLFFLTKDRKLHFLIILLLL